MPQLSRAAGTSSAGKLPGGLATVSPVQLPLFSAVSLPKKGLCDSALCGGELCSKMLTLSVLLAAGAAPQYPNGYFYGCAPGGIATKMPFCDPSLTIPARVKDVS